MFLNFVGVMSCFGLKNVGVVVIDGEYFIYVCLKCNMLMKVYCYGMNISIFKEFVMLLVGV